MDGLKKKQNKSFPLIIVSTKLLCHFIDMLESNIFNREQFGNFQTGENCHQKSFLNVIFGFLSYKLMSE